MTVYASCITPYQFINPQSTDLTMTISIRGVTFTYPGATTPVLRDLHLEITQGEFVAIVGNNGSGKTSLCKLLTGIIPHFFQGDFEGNVLVSGRDTWVTRVADLSSVVGYVYQDFENQLLKPRVLDDVAFAPLNFGYPDYRERAEKALAILGLSELSDRIIWELSGGEQHLIALAGAIALEPEIIVVDEPISQLDPQNAQIVYEKLTLLNRELGKTILVIEHHPESIGAYCDSVVLLKQGQVVWKLPTQAALSRVDELIAHDIYPPQVTRIVHQLNGHAAATYPVTLDEGTRYLKQWVGSRGREQTTPDPAPIPTAPSAHPLVTFQNISHSYKTLDGGRKPVLQDVYLNFHPGERVALVGANGAGKSTLLKMITGLVRPQEGRVHVLGQDARTQSPEKLANHVALIYQDPQQMFIEDSIRGDVGFFLKERQVADAEAIVAKAVEDFRLQEIHERDGRLLSGGQMRRASLAIGACMRPQIMLLDEPTSSLDVANRRQIAVMLRQLETWVRLVMIATHDMELVAEWATRVVVLQRGRVIADGTPTEIFSNPNLLDKARIRLPQVVRLSHALKFQPVHLSVEDFVAYLLDQPAAT